MHIAFNGDSILSPLTGVGQYAKSLLQNLDARADGVRWSDEIHSSIMSASSKSFKPLIRKYVPCAYEIKRHLEQWCFNSGLKSIKPDVYHEPNFLAFSFDGPSVITVHDLSWLRYPEMHPVGRVRTFNKYFEKGLRRASRIITDSAFVKNELIDVFGVNPKIIHPVYLGVDDLFVPRGASDTASVLSELSLSHGQYFLAVGTLEPRKNLGLVLDAYASLPSSLRDQFPLVIVGMKGWNTADLERKLGAMVASGHVRKLGYLSRDDLAVVMAGATAMVYPSVYEGFGLPPLEAMSSAVPVIATNVSSIPEVVGDSGLLIDPADVDGLVECMIRLGEDDMLRTALANKALARSMQFSWDRCADQTVAVYRAAVA